MLQDFFGFTSQQESLEPTFAVTSHNQQIRFLFVNKVEDAGFAVGFFDGALNLEFSLLLGHVEQLFFGFGGGFDVVFEQELVTEFHLTDGPIQEDFCPVGSAPLTSFLKSSLRDFGAVDSYNDAVEGGRVVSFAFRPYNQNGGSDGPNDLGGHAAQQPFTETTPAVTCHYNERILLSPLNDLIALS